MAHAARQERRVLYVEDNPADAALVREHLRAFGSVELVLAVSRDEALQRVGESVPDLVLVDLSLPGGNGIHLIRDLRHADRTRYTPVVVFSGSERDSDVRLCLSAGASAFVRKPSDPAAYQARLDSIVSFWCQAAEPTPAPGASVR